MKTLKQKWTEALPVFFSVLCLIGIIYLLIWGMVKFGNWIQASPPLDTRSVEEIKKEKYKDCIKYVNRLQVEECKNYLK